jgi:hypothetical protein
MQGPELEGKMSKGLRLVVAATLLVFGIPAAKALAFGSDARADALGRIPVGSSEFEVAAPRGPVTVYVHRPASVGRNSPIWIVMHGVRREAYRHIAWDYYDVWARLADQYGALLLVPEFTEEKWPSFWNYTLGNVLSPRLQPIPWDHSSFYVVEQAFRTAARLSGSSQNRFSMFGHGAGAQFVQRYVLHTGGRLVNRVVAANPGWYMLPDHQYTFPFGLRGTTVAAQTLRRAFASDFVLLLGQNDVNYSGGLRNDPEAVAQGKTRYERGHFYFRRARNTAARLGAPFNWQLREVPGAGHDVEEMSPTAAALMARAAVAASN